MKKWFVVFWSFAAVFLMFSISISHADINTGLVAYYPFNGNATDASGNGNNGTVNGATITTDRFGNANSAFSFDGVDDSIVAPHSSSLNITGQEISISFWIFWQNPDNDYNFVGIGKGLTEDGGDGYELAMRGSWAGDTGVLGWGAHSYSGVSITNANSLKGRWVHVVGTINAQQSTLYIDGQNVNTSPTFGTAISGNTRALYMGTRSPGHNYIGWLNGKLDDIRIYNRALSEAEVNALYNEVDPAVNPPPPQPVAHQVPVHNGLWMIPSIIAGLFFLRRRFRA